MRNLIVNTNTPSLLSKYVLNEFPNLSYSSFMKALRNKDIKVNQKRINKDILVSNKDILDIYISDNILFSIPSNIKYYLNDENIVIAYKWQGIVTNNEEAGSLCMPTFEEVVKKDLKLDFLKVCHRLDTNTSGIVIFAKSEKVFSEIKKAFEERKIEKHYIAYVYNSNFEKKSDIMKTYLFKDSKTGFAKITSKASKYAKEITTEYNVIEINKKDNYAILDVSLHTGRTHQIRAHLSYIGHPIIGDSKYGKNEVNRKFKKKRQLLTAYKYIFNLDRSSMLSYLNDQIIEIKKEDLQLI